MTCFSITRSSTMEENGKLGKSEHLFWMRLTISKSQRTTPGTSKYLHNHIYYWVKTLAKKHCWIHWHDYRTLKTRIVIMAEGWENKQFKKLWPATLEFPSVPLASQCHQWGSTWYYPPSKHVVYFSLHLAARFLFFFFLTSEVDNTDGTRLGLRKTPDQTK